MRLALTLAALAFPAAASAQAPEAREAFVEHYTCEGGAHLAAAYINTPEGESYAVVVFDGKMTPMKVGISASGARYVSLTEPALVWHTKGNDGFLAHDDADETMIARSCVSKG